MVEVASSMCCQHRGRPTVVTVITGLFTAREADLSGTGVVKEKLQVRFFDRTPQLSFRFPVRRCPLAGRGANKDEHGLSSLILSAD